MCASVSGPLSSGCSIGRSDRVFRFAKLGGTHFRVSWYNDPVFNRPGVWGTLCAGKVYVPGRELDQWLRWPGRYARNSIQLRARRAQHSWALVGRIVPPIRLRECHNHPVTSLKAGWSAVQPVAALSSSLNSTQGGIGCCPLIGEETGVTHVTERQDPAVYYTIIIGDLCRMLQPLLPG
jgi:hypothetical protein